MKKMLTDAARVIAEQLPATPLVSSHVVPGAGTLLLKCEMMQPTGSFKIRGASYVISQLDLEQHAAGVVAYSTGNHAQAVACAAVNAGIPATIVMSPDAPADKVSATASFGAEIVMAEPTSFARQKLAEAIAAETGAALIPPYDDMRVIAGQGSIGFELRQQLDTGTAATVYVPIGGGGLIAGVASALRLLRPDISIVGVEPALENDAYRSFTARRLVAAEGPSDSIADAIKVQCLGELTFPIILDMVDEIEVEGEDAIRKACRQLVEEEHIVAEPAAAVAYAVARRRAQDRPGLHIALLTGGNISWSRLVGLLG